MRRGDIVTIAISGDFGKPRPAVVIQHDLLNEEPSLKTVLVCLITSSTRDVPAIRLDLPARSQTGLQREAQIMGEKLFAVKRERVGGIIGHIEPETLLELNQRLAFVLGIS